MKLEALDLNLLLALDALAAERSVTRAAHRLGVSQPAMSGSLARLRALFGDPLFVRGGGEMRPTPRAAQLAGPVAEALGRLRAVLEPAPGFRPGNALREFRIAAIDYVEGEFLGALVMAVRREAPDVTLRVVRPELSFVAPAALLRAEAADLAIGLYPALPPARSELRGAALGEERLVGALRAGHPLARRRLTLREFARLPQIRISYGDDQRMALMDTLLRSRGLERNVALTVSHMVTVASLVADSDLLGMLPERLVARRSRELRQVRLPLAVPPLTLAMVWHERRSADPALAWLRDVTERALRHA